MAVDVDVDVDVVLLGRTIPRIDSHDSVKPSTDLIGRSMTRRGILTLLVS